MINGISKEIEIAKRIKGKEVGIIPPVLNYQDALNKLVSSKKDIYSGNKILKLEWIPYFVFNATVSIRRLLAKPRLLYMWVVYSLETKKAIIVDLVTDNIEFDDTLYINKALNNIKIEKDYFKEDAEIKVREAIFGFIMKTNTTLFVPHIEYSDKFLLLMPEWRLELDDGKIIRIDGLNGEVH